MNRAPIICCHCGRDYSRDYWLLGPASDPNVCTGCRRDTNPEASDAPRWEPRANTDDQSPSPVFVVSPARKQCRVCRDVYDGLVFGSPVCKGTSLPFGICPKCERAETLANAPVVPYTVTVRE